VSALPRLLPASGGSHAAHVDRYGPLPPFRRPAELLAAVERAGLTGRGGAGFPAAAKLRVVSAGRSPIVVANGVEGEPASVKDKALMRQNPHLVLDGAVSAAAVVGADEVIVAVSRGDRSSSASLRTALAERAPEAAKIRLVAAPARFVAGEESALVHLLNGGPAKPTFVPPRPFERGVGGRPTLVQNVETLANLGLIARYGPDWFRALGTPDEAGPVLVTIRGAVRAPRVIEAAAGPPLRELVDRCGGCAAPPRALLVGGYFGTWLPARGGLDLPLSEAALRPLGASPGARTIVVLPEGACGIAETARVARYIAAESAGQCGPCLFGLDAIAQALETVAAAGPRAADAFARLGLLEGQIPGRGACRHPDGAVRLVASALRTFADELEAHLGGRRSAAAHEPVLPIPSEDWAQGRRR